MWGALIDILRLSTGSVVWGVLIALVMMALFIFIVRGWWKDAMFTPVTYVLGGVLTLLLMFQCTMMVGALKIIDMTDYYEEIMQHAVETSYSYLDREATHEETDRVVKELVAQVPLLQHYIGSGWSEGITLRDVPHAMADELRAYMRSYIVRRLLWSLGFVVVLGVIAIKTMERPGRGNSRSMAESRTGERGRTPIGNRARDTRVSRRRR
jgi:small-conductance mechanosensitive channel